MKAYRVSAPDGGPNLRIRRLGGKTILRKQGANAKHRDIWKKYASFPAAFQAATSLLPRTLII